MKLKTHICIIFLIILVGCAPNHSSNSTLPFATTTKLPSSVSQLTYVMPFMLDGKQYQGIFAMEVGCLDKITPCFGSPELLLKIPTQNDSNPVNPYGHISGYSWFPNGKKSHSAPLVLMKNSIFSFPIGTDVI